jgi:hypothetical protein
MSTQDAMVLTIKRDHDGYIWAYFHPDTCGAVETGRSRSISGCYGAAIPVPVPGEYIRACLKMCPDDEGDERSTYYSLQQIGFSGTPPRPGWEERTARDLMDHPIR